MLKGIARIALICVGALFIWKGIAQLMSDFNSVKTLFDGGIMEAFQKFTTDADAKNLVISFLKDCLWMLVALTAIISGLLGKGGFWMTLFVGVSLIFIGIDIYNKVQTGAFTSDLWGTIKGIAIDFALQLGYVASAILLKIGCARAEKKANA